MQVCCGNDSHHKEPHNVAQRKSNGSDVAMSNWRLASVGGNAMIKGSQSSTKCYTKLLEGKSERSDSLLAFGYYLMLNLNLNLSLNLRFTTYHKVLHKVAQRDWLLAISFHSRGHNKDLQHYQTPRTNPEDLNSYSKYGPEE